jgi:hypothetical protein
MKRLFEYFQDELNRLSPYDEEIRAESSQIGES